MHAHTFFSDGAETPEKMVARAKAIGMDGIAITDHDSTRGWKRAINAGKHLGVAIVPGKEIRIRKGKEPVGEMLALFLNQDVDLNQLVSIGELVDAIRAQDGIVAIPHPYDWLRKNDVLEILEEKKIRPDAIEAINGRNMENGNMKCMEYATTKKIGQIAGSDAHCTKELGWAYTYCETDNLEEFRKMIKKNQSMAIGVENMPLSIIANKVESKIRNILSFKK